MAMAECDKKLSWGILPELCDKAGEVEGAFLLQVVDVEIVDRGFKFYWITIYDGVGTQKALLARELLPLISSGRLRKGTFFVTKMLKKTMSTIILQDIQILDESSHLSVSEDANGYHLASWNLDIHPTAVHLSLRSAAEMTHSLSCGALRGIMNGEVQERPVLQVLAAFLDPDKNQRLVLTDGAVVQQGVLSPELCRLSHVQEGDIIQLLEYFCLNIDYYKHIIIIKMSIKAKKPEMVNQKPCSEGTQEKPCSKQPRQCCSNSQDNMTPNHSEMTERIALLQDAVEELNSEFRQMYASNALERMRLQCKMNADRFTLEGQV
ncbi:replication protein A 70 kDa DNA-binding subunit A [Canna indica]|uniref:Replication protein A 70 kDa DNA-binding subunit A n=1 Tax=Canna indica TaxID=4628 RepID=A0AAQ3QBW9_9LILI|nr:replication protein A 70 kDa DNA-binding subunit A [Canna indica]